MKRLCNILCALLLLGTMTSCEDWLDVDPKSEVKSDVMFQSVSGFKDALTGIYLLMSDQDLYGREATWGFVDALAQQTDVRGGEASAWYNATRYNYSATTTSSNGIWSKSYNIIANVNFLLENLEKKKEMFAPAMYAVIKGEALGLRAFLHFDLLRLFGWGDLEKSPENLDRLCLPYVSEYSWELQKQLTVGEALEKVIADLQESMELLNDNDPFGLTPKPDDYDLPNEDKFFEDRHKRFNYWAAVCTLTRVYMWMGNKAEALPLAELFVKEGGETSWISSYVIDAYDPADRDLTFTTEHVFALDVTKLFENMQYYMNPKANDPNENTDLLYHAKARASGLFESTDYRLARWYDQTGNEHYDGWAFVKFWEVEKYKYGSTMPLIRKSEMYYIAAECLLATGKDADRLLAIERLNTVREKRGMSGLGNDLTVVSVQNEITKEYQREFINEGQLFYYYKRLGFEKIPYATKAATDAVYVVPLPTWDVDLGGMEDYKK